MGRLERELFKRIFTDSPIGIELYDSEGKLLDANKAYLEMFGVSNISEIKGFELFKDPNIPEGEMKKLKSGETVRYEVEFDFEKVKKFNLYKTTKSNIMNLDVLITPLYEDGTKSIINYLVQVQDITKRKKEEEFLCVERFKALFKGIPVPTYAWQKVENDFKLIDYNNAAEDITLGSVKNYIGKKAVEMYRDRPEILKDLNYCIEKKTNFSREMKYYFQSLKKEKLILAKYSFIPPDLVLVHTEDITERKKFEEDLLKEKEFTEMALNAQRDTLFIFNPSTGKAIRWNKAFNEFSGYNDEEISSMKAPDSYYSQEDLKRAYKTINKILKEGEGIIQMDLINKDGKTIPFEYSASIMRDKANNPMYIVSIGRDITDRRKAEQIIKESENKFRTLFEANPDLFLLFSKDTTILEYHGPREDFYLPPDKFLGKKISDVLPSRISDLSVASVKLTLKTKKPQIVEYSLPIGGKNRFFEARHLYFSENKVAVFIRDITERKQAELNLKKSEKNYREAYNKSNFYKDILMHDISNVLQNIQSSVELFPIIQNKPEDIRGIDNLTDIIQKSIDRGTNLISNVRKLSQLEDTEITLQSIELCEILKESIKFMRKSFQEKEIVVHIESPDTKLYVNANELLLDVFENILINAAKYNNNSIVYVFIKIYKERRQNIKYIRIDFIDNGVGIPDANKKVIFQKGFKKETKIKGMGIGLSLVKKVLESYNGQIWVENKVKGDYTQGSNFIVLIPEVE